MMKTNEEKKLLAAGFTLIELMISFALALINQVPMKNWIRPSHCKGRFARC